MSSPGVGALNGSTTTLTPWNSSSWSPGSARGRNRARTRPAASAALDGDPEHLGLAGRLLRHQLADLRRPPPAVKVTTVSYSESRQLPC